MNRSSWISQIAVHHQSRVMQRLQWFFQVGILMCLICCLVMTLTGCWLPASGTTATSQTNPLVGQWTTNSDRTPVTLNSRGEPESDVLIGEWYTFQLDGQYSRVYRYVTFAVGGVSVEEGRYQWTDTTLRLYERTESFFPDEGSPQKAKYRSPLDEAVTFTYRLDYDQGHSRLHLRPAGEEPELAYLPVTIN